jgi:effector-binding domain-containing protein
MSDSPHLVTLEPTTVAVVRETVPMSELTAFFDRVFTAVMAAVEAQGLTITGPPVAVYHGVPDGSVDVAAGFPTSAPVAPAEGGVVASALPCGRAAQLLHVGSYDSLAQAYERITAWLGEQELTPADIMWESYLNEPDPDDPDASETLITWPMA